MLALIRGRPDYTYYIDALISSNTDFGALCAQVYTYHRHLVVSRLCLCTRSMVLWWSRLYDRLFLTRGEIMVVG